MREERHQALKQVVVQALKQVFVAGVWLKLGWVCFWVGLFGFSSFGMLEVEFGGLKSWHLELRTENWCW